MPNARFKVAVLECYEEPVRRILRSELDDMTLVFAGGQAEEERLNAARDADVFLVGSSVVNDRILDASDRLRLVQKLGVGVDRIDLEDAERRGVAVFMAAGVNAAAVAEMAVLLMLSVLRNIPWACAELRKGNFTKESLRTTNHQLAGLSVGLLGFGHVGRQVARRLQGFDAAVRFHDLRERPDETFGASYAPLDDLIAESDVLSLHLPWTPSTHGIIDRDRIASMKPGAVIVNTARGGLIDEPALCEALGSGALMGAGLDVTAEEPITPDSPLWACPRILITPHMAGAVLNNFPNVARRAAANVRAFLTGRTVDPDDVIVMPPGVGWRRST